MGRFGDVKHISFSYSDYIFDLDFQERTAGKFILDNVEMLLDYYMKDGFYAGVLIPHNERKKHEDGSECSFKSYYEYGKLVNCPKGPHVWVWGPHVHYVGYGYLPFTGKEFYDLTDVIYYNIPDDGDRSIKATVFYLLTHSANYRNLTTEKCTRGYRFVGKFHQRYTKLDKTLSAEEMCLCGINGCECPLHRFKPALDKNLKLIEDPYLEIDEGEYRVKKKIKYWTLKDKKDKQSKL